MEEFVIKFLVSYSLSEIDFQIFSESAAVIVPRCFRVPKTFQQRRSLENLLGHEIVRRAVNSCQILHYEFRGFRFSWTGFTGNNNHLIRAGVIRGSHLAVRRRAHGKQMAANCRVKILNERGEGSISKYEIRGFI